MNGFRIILGVMVRGVLGVIVMDFKVIIVIVIAHCVICDDRDVRILCR